jgi:hypothetical protein
VASDARSGSAFGPLERPFSLPLDRSSYPHRFDDDQRPRVEERSFAARFDDASRRRCRYVGLWRSWCHHGQCSAGCTTSTSVQPDHPRSFAPLKVSNQTVFAVTSLKPDQASPAEFVRLWRSHWRVQRCPRSAMRSFAKTTPQSARGRLTRCSRPFATWSSRSSTSGAAPHHRHSPSASSASVTSVVRKHLNLETSFADSTGVRVVMC